MGIYDDLLTETQSGGRFGNLEKVADSVIVKLKQTYLGIPADFLAFLEEIGSGELGQSAYVIYNGLLEPGEIYDEGTAENLDGILIFGDDMQGYCSGFIASQNWIVVEIDPTDMSYQKSFDTFSDFIRDKLNDI